MNLASLQSTMKKKKKPAIYYLVTFPLCYRHRSWFHEKDRDYARLFLKAVKEKYGVRGKLVKVKECR